MEGPFKLGDILKLEWNNRHCVVVGLSGQTLDGEEVPEAHIAVWFGAIDATDSDSQGSGDISGKSRMEVWTIPEEYFKKGPEPLVSH